MSKLDGIAALYDCQVMHKRLFPQHYRFQYRVFSLLLDIDQLEKIGSQRLLGINRFNLLSVYTKDHGARNAKSWRTWIDETLMAQGLEKFGSKVQLQCFPRVLGYGFNPLSLWYCYNKQAELGTVICEVSNTFGEYHHYILHNKGKPLTLPVKAEKKKIFHVSPFITMDQEYQFSIDKPDERLRLIIREYEHNDLMLVAAQHGTRKPLTTSIILAYFLKVPMLTFKVMLMIHWHAMKLWLSGAKFYHKPEPPDEMVS